MNDLTPGEIAYDGYFKACGGKSLISGVPLPLWAEQSDAIRTAWEAAGVAAILTFDLDGHDRPIRRA